MKSKKNWMSVLVITMTTSQLAMPLVAMADDNKSDGWLGWAAPAATTLAGVVGSGLGQSGVKYDRNHINSSQETITRNNSDLAKWKPEQAQLAKEKIKEPTDVEIEHAKRATKYYEDIEKRKLAVVTELEKLEEPEFRSAVETYKQTILGRHAAIETEVTVVHKVEDHLATLHKFAKNHDHIRDLVIELDVLEHDSRAVSPLEYLEFKKLLVHHDLAGKHEANINYKNLTASIASAEKKLAEATSNLAQHEKELVVSKKVRKFSLPVLAVGVAAGIGEIASGNEAATSIFGSSEKELAATHSRDEAMPSRTDGKTLQ